MTPLLFCCLDCVLFITAALQTSEVCLLCCEAVIPTPGLVRDNNTRASTRRCLATTSEGSTRPATAPRQLLARLGEAGRGVTSSSQGHQHQHQTGPRVLSALSNLATVVCVRMKNHLFVQWLSGPVLITTLYNYYYNLQNFSSL